MDGLFIGLMSGTSLDGIDGVLCAFGAGSQSERVRVLAHAYQAFPTELARDLLALNTPGNDELHRAAIAANHLARLSAQVVEALLTEGAVRRERVLAIGTHGQTVRHRPGEFDATGYTIQLNAPALLAELTGVAVIADFRSRDVAAEGQGAPLVPAFHRAAFAHVGGAVGVLNVGGIANLSVLGPEATIGFDCGPGNALMDHWCRLHVGMSFDDRGAWAASGAVNATLLADMLGEPYFSRLPPKSTGRDLFNPFWLDACLLRFAAPRPLRPEDVQATLAELTACACASAVVEHAPGCSELLTCGGGSLNTHLMTRLAERLPGIRVAPTDSRGLPAMQVEACAFAWLARAWMAREPGNLCQVTGAKGPRVLGALYPAR